LYDSPSDAFLTPFDASVESLFDGDHTTEEVFSGLPETLEELITAAFLEQLREPSGALREALAEASRVCSWRLEVPVTVYASSSDVDVPIDNAPTLPREFPDQRRRGHVDRPGRCRPLGVNVPQRAPRARAVQDCGSASAMMRSRGK
jgi:hypothetical protein